MRPRPQTRLLEALQACEAEGDDAGRDMWRRRLYEYLHRVFLVRGGAAPRPDSCVCRAPWPVLCSKPSRHAPTRGCALPTPC
jgi:hypothetical protein